MDATSRKAMFRARIREAAESKEKRIDSPLVRYNDLGQPVCKVCNVPVKSEAFWGAHLASRQHKETADELKERAKRSTAAEASKKIERPDENAPQDSKAEDEEAPSTKAGTLPQGFFDNKESDMKARGIQPQKIDLQEEMKEFQRLIEDDIKKVDERYAEDEALEAEIRIEEEEVEQVICLDRVDTLKRRKIELEDSKPSTKPKPAAENVDKLLEELSSDDDSDDDLVMDWRAKQL